MIKPSLLALTLALSLLPGCETNGALNKPPLGVQSVTYSTGPSVHTQFAEGNENTIVLPDSAGVTWGILITGWGDPPEAILAVLQDGIFVPATEAEDVPD